MRQETRVASVSWSLSPELVVALLAVLSPPLTEGSDPFGVIHSCCLLPFMGFAGSVPTMGLLYLDLGEV